MKRNKTKRLIAAGALLCSANTLITGSLHAAVIDFESVPLGSPNGPNGVWNGQAGTGGLVINGVGFNNTFTDFGGGYTGWTGFAFSNQTNTTTPGYGNQYSTFAGGGGLGSSNFGIGYTGASIAFNQTDLTGTGALITNTTYAALSMTSGDGFAKKFGGTSGDDPDFFKLIISGYVGGSATGRTFDFYLADYRSNDNSLDYILNEWRQVDFSALGVADEIRFGYESSDVGIYGINTPTYFAIDNLTAVPEPSALALVSLGCLAACGYRRRG